MEILLPKRNDSAQTEKLLSRTVTVVAGKSRFGVEIARRIQDHAFWLSAQKALCIMPPHEVWPGSIEAMYQEFMEYSYYVSKDTPTEFDQLLFLLLRSAAICSSINSKRQRGGISTSPRLVWIEFKSCGNGFSREIKCCGPRGVC